MLRIVNPATEQVIEEIAEDSADSVAQKVHRAQKAQPLWAKVSLETRKDVIFNFCELLVERYDDLAKILAGETGKPISQARAEIKATPTRIEFFLAHFEDFLQTETVYQQDNMEERISYEPLGVIANISAWNYPYFVGSNVFIPALLTGNTVLYKPSEFATLTGLAIADLFKRAGLPPDVFTTVVGDGFVGARLLEHPLNAVFFTGSVATGRRIAQEATRHFMKVQLELGGKDPLYVCEDVNVDHAAVGAAEGVFYNNGQSCCAVERLYVHEKIFDGFLTRFVKAVESYPVGDPLDENTFIGPLARKAQIAVLEDQIHDAVGKGAKVVLGGKPIGGRKGYYFAPTVLTNVNHDMKLMREESFGPIIGIMQVKDDAQAAALMNDTSYGLTAAVYSKSRPRAEAILTGLDTGTAYWNCCDRVSPRLPWTGRRESGIGSTLSLEGIRAFLHPKAWHLRSSA